MPISGSEARHDIDLLNALVEEHPEWREQYRFLQAERHTYPVAAGFVLTLAGLLEEGGQPTLLGVLDPSSGEEMDPALLDPAPAEYIDGG